MAVVADFGVDVEIVEHAELARERVRVGGDLLTENRERWIAISALDVAENLIVGSVLANHVEDVLDRRRVADPRGDRELTGAAIGAKWCWSVYGVTAYTIFVSACSVAVVGAGRIETVPVRRLPMYCWSPPGVVRIG